LSFGAARFLELEPGPVRTFVLMIRAIAIALIIGGLGSFLLTLIAMITIQESFSDVDASGYLDSASRLSVGVSSLVAIAGGAFYAIADLADSLTLGTALSRRYGRSPELVAPFHQRGRVGERETFLGVRVLLWMVLVVALFALALGIYFVVDEEDVTIGVILVVASTVVAFLCVLPQGWLGRGGPGWWRRVRAGLREAWSHTAIAAATSGEADARRGPALALNRARDQRFAWIIGAMGRSALVIFVGAFAAGMGGVFLRQPCRSCSERYFDQPVENLINVIVAIGSALAALGILALFLMALISAARIVLRRADLARIARFEGQLKPTAINDDVTSPSAMGMTGVGVLSLTVALTLAVASLTATAPTETYRFGDLHLFLGALAALGLVLVLTGIIAAPRYRNTLRSRWLPGDVRPMTPQRSRQATREPKKRRSRSRVGS
jgi:hypothetical protein